MEPVPDLSRSVRGLAVLVTGAASGRGRATATVFAREGAKVAVTDVRLEDAEAVAEEIRRLETAAALNAIGRLANASGRGKLMTDNVVDLIDKEEAVYRARLAGKSPRRIAQEFNLSITSVQEIIERQSPIGNREADRNPASPFRKASIK